MKIFVKFMIFSVVLAMAGPFVMKGPSGQPLVNLSNLMPSFDTSNIPGAGNLSGIAGSTNQMVGKQRFYKWKDKNGVWQFSQTAPPADVENEPVDVYPDANIIQSLSKDKIDLALGRTTPEPTSSVIKAPANPLDNMGSSLFPTTVPLDKIPELINNARAVQDMMNQRGEQLKNL